MAFSSISGSHTSSTLFPLSTSHLHPIRKAYEFPSFDDTPSPSPSSSSSSSNLKHATSSNFRDRDTRPSSSFYNFENTANAEIREGLERLDLARKREKNVQSAAPDIPLRQNTPPRQPQAFFPVSYIRGEWMQKLLNLDLGKRKIRYFLSDETLCLGTPLAPITSEFSSGLTFYEAYTILNPDEHDAKVYMSEEQVNWLIDELYSILGIKNSKLVFEDVNIDINKKINLKDFKAIRKISFKNNVAGFRKKCGIPIFNKASLAEHKIVHETEGRIKQNWRNGAITAKVTSAATIPSSSMSKQTGFSPASTENTSQKPTAPTSPANNKIVSGQSSEQGKVNLEFDNAESSTTSLAPTAAPKSFASMTKAERQARLQAQREEALRRHLELQRQLLPSHRQFYRNLERYGGAALACDVESWTEDAEVLLELGMAWFVWKPSDSDEGVMERDGGSCHYIIEETVQYKNEEIEATRWDYSLGKSETLPQQEVSKKLKMKIQELSKYGPLVLVFHDASAETRYFQRLGVDSDIFYTTPPDHLSISRPQWPSIPLQQDSMIIIQDTQNLYAGWSNPQIKQINLGKACLNFGLEDEAKKLHNAGNDAFATLRVWEILLEMEMNERQSEAKSTGPVQWSKGLKADQDKLTDDIKQAQKEPNQLVESTFPDLIELW